MGSAVGGEGGEVDLDAMVVSSGDELNVGLDEVFEGGVVSGCCGGVAVFGVADVVDAFEEDEVADAGQGDAVVVEARESAGAGAEMEEAVAADAFVDDGDMFWFWRRRGGGGRAGAGQESWARLRCCGCRR